MNKPTCISPSSLLIPWDLCIQFTQLQFVKDTDGGKWDSKDWAQDLVPSPCWPRVPFHRQLKERGSRASDRNHEGLCLPFTLSFLPFSAPPWQGGKRSSSTEGKVGRHLVEFKECWLCPECEFKDPLNGSRPWPVSHFYSIWALNTDHLKILHYKVFGIQGFCIFYKLFYCITFMYLPTWKRQLPSQIHT